MIRLPSLPLTVAAVTVSLTPLAAAAPTAHGVFERAAGQPDLPLMDHGGLLPDIDHDHDHDGPEALRIGGRWGGNRNAAGFTGVRGDGITLSYGVVPDGTNISSGVGEPAGPSDLVAFMNANIGPESRWSPLIDDAYQRWGELSGLTMVRETRDDGNAAGGISGSSFPQGVTGVRADMRIGGHSIDGQSGSNTLAYNYFPSGGDHVVDTDNSSFYRNGTNNYRGFRNVFMHEAGHGLGISHLESNNGRFLMEPSINTGFDGPQLDDILSVQRNYGDRYEAAGGNDTRARATPLGSLTPAAVTGPTAFFAVGTDASDTSTVVGGNDVDFVSIDGTSDRDAYGFTLTDAGVVTLQLDPRGPTYNEGPQKGTQSPLMTKAFSDLAMDLLDATGGVLGTANLTDAGFAETLVATLAAGDYFALIRAAAGAEDNVQLYELNVSAVVVPEPTAAAAIALGSLALLRRRRSPAT